MNTPFPEVAYIQDILQQPIALENTLTELRRMDFSLAAHYGEQLHSGRLERVILTGMGSSYHALHPLLLGLLRHGIPAQMVETSELIHHATRLITPNVITVAVSQSGASVEMLGLLKKLSKGAGLIGVTNTPESPLALRADVKLLTQAGNENSVSCKTYISGLAALAVLESVLTGGKPSTVFTDLGNLPDIVEGYLSNLQVFIGDLEERLIGVSYLVLAGRGVSLSAAGTGGLIIKEAAHFPAEGMSSAAFRHGPLEMASPKTFVLVFEGLDPTRELNRNLVAEIQNYGGKAALVEMTEGMEVFHLPTILPFGLPILEILPAQMLSVALARLQNHVPGEFSLGSKVTSIE